MSRSFLDFVGFSWRKSVEVGLGVDSSVVGFIGESRLNPSIKFDHDRIFILEDVDLFPVADRAIATKSWLEESGTGCSRELFPSR